MQVPRELKRHLFSIEEKILEAQAWEKGSSLYPLLTAACSSARSSADNSPSNRGHCHGGLPQERVPQGMTNHDCAVPGAGELQTCLHTSICRPCPAHALPCHATTFWHSLALTHALLLCFSLQ